MARVFPFVFFLNLIGKLSAFHHYYIGCGFVVNGLYIVELCSLYAHFNESFNHECMLNFFKCFSWVYWDDHMIFIFHFVNVVYITLTNMWTLNHPCDPKVNQFDHDTWWSNCWILMYCWIWLANILLGNFPSIFIKDIGSKFCFFIASLVWVSGQWWPRRISLGVFHPLQFWGIV